MNSKNKIAVIVALSGILTFSIIALTSLSINQASAQMADCQPTLSLASFPKTGTVGSDGTLPVNLWVS